MVIKSIPEDWLQKDDYVSCVNGVTGITGPLFIIQDRRSDLAELFQHAVEEAATEPNKKCSVAALSHLQDFIHAINHDLINWEDLTHNHMTQDFWGPFTTYMGNYARNKTKVKFADGNSSTSKKSAEIREKLRQLLFQ